MRRRRGTPCSCPRRFSCSPRRAGVESADAHLASRPASAPSSAGAWRGCPSPAGRCSWRPRSWAGSSASTPSPSSSELPPDELMDVLNEAMAERVLDDVPGAPGAFASATSHQGHALRRADRGAADAAPQGGRRGARGRLRLRPGAPPRRAGAALRGRRPGRDRGQGARVRAPGRATGPPRSWPSRRPRATTRSRLTLAEDERAALRAADRAGRRRRARRRHARLQGGVSTGGRAG